MATIVSEKVKAIVIVAPGKVRAMVNNHMRKGEREQW
jgi:hypothetical protein